MAFHTSVYSLKVQSRYAPAWGTRLTYRREDEYTKVNTYHLADEGWGYFVEVGTNEVNKCIVVQCSFSSAGPLAGYVAEVKNLTSQL